MGHTFYDGNDEYEELIASESSLGSSDEEQRHPTEPAAEEQEPQAAETAEAAEAVEAVEGKSRKRSTASARARRSSRAGAEPADSESVGIEGILQFPAPAEAETAEAHGSEDEGEEQETLLELEAQGFTPDEAQRLIHISDRLATSSEARESEVTLRRLRFTRWLVEHGVLDEFSA